MQRDNAINEGCSKPDCELTGDHAHLRRYTFRLPEPIGIEDGFSVQNIYHSDDPDSQPTFAHLTIHQVEMESDDPTTLSMKSIARLDRTTTGGGDLPKGQANIAQPQSLHSVARVITLANSPDQPAQDWNQQTQNLEPREDSFMRALHAVQTLVRGVKLANLGRPPLLPTYERAPLMVLVDDLAVETPFSLDALGGLEWGETAIMFLNHQNSPGYRPQVVPVDLVNMMGREIGQGNPAILAKERLIDAHRLIHVDGEYGAAVVSAATGIEVLSDSLLSALLWEDHIQSECGLERALSEASNLFSGDVTPLKRAQAHTVSRLGGDWTSSGSPWQIYRGGAASLRNRIVHAGYQPKRAEAIKAYQQSLSGQTFLFDRLAAQCGKYPRTCHVFLGSQGLEKRNLYTGKIKQFFEQTALSEPAYSTHFSVWHRSLISKVRA